ncbi:MAG: hypothetical protein KDB23_31825, partial [Planctomycetales bacterium]|nr:hypothetical protein [Planctomycetales bacterium]
CPFPMVSAPPFAPPFLTGLSEVLWGDGQVVPAGDLRRVAQSLGHDMQGELVGQLRFPAGPEVVEQSGPRLHVSAS